MTQISTSSRICISASKKEIMILRTIARTSVNVKCKSVEDRKTLLFYFLLVWKYITETIYFVFPYHSPENCSQKRKS